MTHDAFLKAITAFDALPKESVEAAKLIASELDEKSRKALYNKLLVVEARMRVLRREEKSSALELESLVHGAQKNMRTLEEDSSKAKEEGAMSQIESSIDLSQ